MQSLSNPGKQTSMSKFYVLTYKVVYHHLAESAILGVGLTTKSDVLVLQSNGSAEQPNSKYEQHYL